jgi:hypothetical protein
MIIRDGPAFLLLLSIGNPQLTDQFAIEDK